ncbi:MAG: hypothetical protein J2P19_11085 [Pseudonocardia sp.]|nr:hypothetical protein [Pseudonocardia sp.]
MVDNIGCGHEAACGLPAIGAHRAPPVERVGRLIEQLDQDGPGPGGDARQVNA